MIRSISGVVSWSALVLLAVAGPLAAQSKVDFNRDIRPILSDKCFACHGPDSGTLKGKLRLDVRDVAIKRGAIVPGKPAESELVRRIHATDANEVMPPAKSNKTLTAAEKELLKRWIASGADYKVHWAFAPPERPALPSVKHAGWPRNPVDHFVLARLEQAGLAPMDEAAKPALLRRVSLDLTGLPPTLAELDAFLQDASPNAYEKAVDRLLQSPRYGEHMARYWLDAARYGDTHGMHLDNYREMYPYRDWVINAFNRNMPFNRFLLEQLAGDLLPGATLDQQVATGFLRCHVTTSEGGSIDEEVYVRNVQDRVDTNGIVLLGLTFGCAKCHDHKYDPVSQKDYYSLFAFFNNLDGSPLDGNAAQHPPIARLATPEQAARLTHIAKRLSALPAEIKQAALRVKYDTAQDEKLPEEPTLGDYVWIDDQAPAGARESPPGGANVPWSYVGKPAPVYSGSRSIRLQANGLTQVVFEGAKPGLKIGAGDKLFAYVWLDPAKPPKEIMLQWHSSNWLHRAYWGDNVIPWGADNSTERRPMGALPTAGQWVRLEVEADKVGIKPGTVIDGWAFTQHDGIAYWDKGGLTTRLPQSERPYETLSAWIGAQKALGGAGLPKPVQTAVKQPRDKRTQAQKTLLLEHFLEHGYAQSRSAVAPLQEEMAQLKKEKDAIEKSTPTTLVFKERTDPRPAFLLKRGEYDHRGDKVDRATPSFLPALPASAAKNRLGFAQWLTEPRHPLTARVAVNRFWQQFFGTGLVRTAEDFGSQGEPPTHPELLDWLAVQFVDDGWDVNKTVRRLVTSAAYRQSGKVTKERLAQDPLNRLVSRGPRYRLDAEMLRDQALYVGGLLVEKVGGPSVKPPQPSGLWEAVAFTGSNTGIFKADVGHEKVHRRSMYTFWKRTAHPPQMGTLDAPSREACLVRRERTNTPLQALLMMNEMLFVEASRGLAERTLRDVPADTDARLRYVFRTVTCRLPDDVELTILRNALAEHLAKYRANPKAAQQLIHVGATTPNPACNAEELAAWTMIGNLVLNLDEVINR